VTDRYQHFEKRRAELLLGGGEERIRKQHQQGKLTARERLGLLLDPDSFVEFGLYACPSSGDLREQTLPADGVVTGKGVVDGRPLFVFAQDFTVSGGSVGGRHASKIVSCMEYALKCGIPVVGINDSGGARIQEGVEALSGYGRIFYHNTLLSGVVPQISVIAGPCAGGAVYSPALTDFVIMVDGLAHMFITGPEVIKASTGETIGEDELGGAAVHESIAGNIHFTAQDERHAFQIVRALLGYLPSNNLESPPVVPFGEVVADDPVLDTILPEGSRQAYDVKEIIARLVDPGSFLEVQAGYAQNIVIGLARLGGFPVGLLANQPSVMAGALDINASDKAARFIRTCNVFNLPLVTLVDVPGFLPGTAQEHQGIIRHGAKMLFAYSAATVPKLTVILRKAYGGSYLAMCSKDLGADAVLAWPEAEIAVMGPEGAARILHRKELAGAADREALLAQKIAEYRQTHANPYRAAEALHVDDVIRPSWTRRLLIERLGILQAVRNLRPHKKHGNIPL
jgi:methylmalonyl-CoA carboxyltransferase large subunit